MPRFCSLRDLATLALSVCILSACGGDTADEGWSPNKSQLEVATHVARDGDVEIGTRASKGVVIRDGRTGLSVNVKLRGVREASRQMVDRSTMRFEAVTEHEGDWTLRLTASGFEDFITLPKSTQGEVRYLLTLSESVAGLRLIRNSLELLDASGAPRLRMRPPVVFGAQGKHHRASVTLEDCDVDSDPRDPWDRAVIDPGSRQCSLRIHWRPDDVRYPAVLDPSWTTTVNDLNLARRFHTASKLPTGRVLIAGGSKDNLSGGLCEVYDPTTNSWANSASLSSVRMRHTTTTLSNGTLIVIGGVNASHGGKDTGVRAIETFNPMSPVPAWTTVASLELEAKQARYGHSAILHKNDMVLAIGGRFPGGGLFNDALTISEPNGVSTRLTNFMPEPRVHHTTTSIGLSDYVVSGGLAQDDLAPYPLLYVGQPVQGQSYVKAGGNSPGSRNTMMQPRLFHAAIPLGANKMLVSGGFGAANSVEFYERKPAPGNTTKEDQWTPWPPLTGGRSKHTMTRLADGMILVAGGQSGISARDDAELFQPKAGEKGQWVPAGKFEGARREHTATLLDTGLVLIVGGNEDLDLYGDPLATSALFARQELSESCSEDGECASLHCVNEVCCNTTCEGACQRCDLDDSKGTCTTLPTKTPSQTCTPYLCDGTSTECPDSCKEDAQCVQDKVCIADQCVDVPPPKEDGAECSHDRMCNSEFCTDGRCCVAESCTPYRCLGANGTCASSCKTSLDCVDETICNSVGHCIAPPKTDTPPSASCRLGPARHTGDESWWLTLAALALAIRRKHRGSGLTSKA